jgi:transcriptional regulator with XRE-family HTH domain
MIRLGKTSRYLRESLGLTQRVVAENLGITIVHLSNIENDKTTPSPDLLDRYYKNWGVDLYVLAWCLYGDLEKLPPAIRNSANELAKAWKKKLGTVIGKKGHWSGHAKNSTG